MGGDELNKNAGGILRVAGFPARSAILPNGFMGCLRAISEAPSFSISLCENVSLRIVCFKFESLDPWWGPEAKSVVAVQGTKTTEALSFKHTN